MEDYYVEKTRRWDTYFHRICEAVASKSPCLSRQIGAILVRDKSIVSTGFNGPARGYPHCEPVRHLMEDISTDKESHYEYSCPRHAAGFKSGEGLEHCPAAHAEMNCVANAARIGASTVGSTLYMNCIIPCKFCMVTLVNAGVKELVLDDTKPYHEMSVEIAIKGGVSMRRFRL
jgi:dCMP deaminase